MYLTNILLNAFAPVLAASDSPASISVDTLKTLSLGVLAVLGVIFILKTLFYDIPGKRKNDISSQPQDSQNETYAAKAVSESYEDETQLIAVITAAVAAYMEASRRTDTENEANGIVSDNINTSFRVVSFKRKSGGEWNRSSR